MDGSIATAAGLAGAVGAACPSTALLSRAKPLERHPRDVLCSRIHTPRQGSATIAAGRAALRQ